MQRYGGISRYFFELASRLERIEGGVLNCWINSPVFVNEYLRRARGELRVSGVFFPALPRTRRIYGLMNSTLSPLTLSFQKPDIVHETYYTKKTAAPHHSKIVVTVYDMIHELYPDRFSKLDRSSELKRVAVERADYVICISENTRRDLIRILGVSPEKTAVVHLGFSLSNRTVPTLRTLKRPFILYVGNREGYKNFLNLLAAYASKSELFGPYDLLAFGGERSLNPQECEIIQRLKIPRERVQHMSGDDDVLAALYRQAAMFVYPSLYEGFGMPPLEAMSYDCPVACSNTSSIPEVVGDAAMYFDPLDINSIADALVCLAEDFGLRAKLIARGRSRLSFFSWEQCAMQTLEIYRGLLR